MKPFNILKPKKEIFIPFGQDLFPILIFLIFLSIFASVIVFISYSFVDNFLMLESSSFLWLTYLLLILWAMVLTKLSTVLIYNFISNYEKKTWNKIVFDDAHADNLIPLFFAMIVVPILILLLAFVVPRNFLYAGFFEHKIDNNYVYREIPTHIQKSIVLRTENTGDNKKDLKNLSCLSSNLSSPHRSNNENKIEIKTMDCDPYSLQPVSFRTIEIESLIFDMLDKKQTSKEIELKLLSVDKIIKWELVIK